MNFKKIILLLIVIIFASGCSISFKGSGGGNDYGVYATSDKGDSWRKKVLIPTTSGKPGSITGLSANSLAMDPNDEKAIYFGSVDNGLFYTYDSANGWKFANDLGKSTINDVAVDPNSKCIIYASTENKVYKSSDCNRTWSQIYYDNNVETTINSMAVDHYNSLNLYIGTSRGEVIKSSDRGSSWKVIGRFEDNVQKIVVSPRDSRLIFAVTSKKGVYRTMDGGDTWKELKENLAEFKNSKNFKDLVVEPQNGVVFLATDYEILKSVDNGEVWSKIELITAEKDAAINAIAISSKNAEEIYYVTDTTFCRSLDGGQNWTIKKLLTSGAGWKLLIDPQNTNIIYMGARKIKK